MQAKSEKDKQEDLKRLLELKKEAEISSLNREKQALLDELNSKYAEYALLNADALEANLKHIPTLRPVSVQSKEIDSIIDDYDKQFAGRPGYKKPETKNGMTVLCFDNEMDAGNFFLTQAQKGRGFRVYDAQMRLIAYSKGDGTLYHANGEVFKTGDSFKPLPGVSNQNFQLPKPEPESPVSNSPTPLSPTPFK
jgi:hypothetical protein